MSHWQTRFPSACFPSRIAAAARMAALLLMVALLCSSGTAAALGHMTVVRLQYHRLWSDYGTFYPVAVFLRFPVFSSFFGTREPTPLAFTRCHSVAGLVTALTLLKAVLSDSSSRAAALIRVVIQRLVTELSGADTAAVWLTTTPSPQRGLC